MFDLVFKLGYSFSQSDTILQEFKTLLREDSIDYVTYTSTVKRKRPTPRNSRSGRSAIDRGDDGDDDGDDYYDEDWTGGPRRLDFSGQRSNGGGRMTRQRMHM